MIETHDTNPELEPEPPVEVPSEFTLDIGATLTIRKPSSMLLAAVMTAVEKESPVPPVPKVWIEEKEREEENPNDPTYKAAIGVWNANAVVRMFKALCVSSLRIKDLGDAFDPDGEDFADYLEALDMEVESGKSTRFLQWLMTYALVKEESKKLNTWMMALAGVTEEDVAEATTFLQGDSTGAASPNPGD